MRRRNLVLPTLPGLFVGAEVLHSLRKRLGHPACLFVRRPSHAYIRLYRPSSFASAPSRWTDCDCFVIASAFILSRLRAMLNVSYCDILLRFVASAGLILPEEGVEENKLYRVSACGVPVVLLRQGQQFCAISATCPNAGEPLDDGTLTGDVVERPWHGPRFHLYNGRVLTGPATVNALPYDVRVHDEQVEVKLVGEALAT